MTGKAYYITTLADWQRHAPRFANSHFIVLDAPSEHACLDASDSVLATAGAAHVECGSAAPAFSSPKLASACSDSFRHRAESQSSGTPGQARSADSGGKPPHSIEASARIMVLIEADEGVHLALEDNPAFEALPHPLAQKPISPAAQSALAPHGVPPGATTFDAAEALARLHPLLKHRVF